ncbi:maltose ABC transporter permease MalF [Aquabacterium sp. OR-4]|uniref:maltose ABC transporter permease MalF n=1 Tax=Aquabacterium sp. OR-4 TaxID=2978127 RepID=UPI0021B35FFB|nr:maltose ABC transporter permease MalF [Aquabacterium sp. OR-4]MDT7834213.1 maltose ABC transporter permease MalF [Aquabacterium sp. OR-4]
MSAPRASSLTRHAVAAATALILLWAVFRTYAAGQPMWALGLLAAGATALTLYASAGKNVAWKYLFPGVAGMLLFAAFPLLYTVQIGFTNYASAHLLSQERARAYLLDQREFDEAGAYDFALLREASGHRLTLTPADGRDGPVLSTAVLDLDRPPAADAAPITATLNAGTATGTPADLRQRIALRPALQALRIQVPGGAVLGYAGLREFAPVKPLWLGQADGSLRSTADGTLARPNLDTGYFETAPGQVLTPGFKVGIGFAHYQRMLADADFRGPFVAIFGWTVTFSALTVIFSTALGLGLAVALNWEGLKHRTLYRTLLFLPYAVPGFISILVFKGLFNQNFGEINAILDGLFGIRPAWFADPLLAKAMLLIVNTWLGYPYIMVLATGLLKAIPADLYEASAIAGAGPWTNFRRITAPLIVRPLMPLLISAFAFNFNNFVLISLLTDGRPDVLNTKLPAGTTDILVSYTYRIAFTDAGQNFGLAAAISTLIFGMVALMALLQLRFMRSADAPPAKR